jgi:hypothetical protein
MPCSAGRSAPRAARGHEASIPFSVNEGLQEEHRSFGGGSAIVGLALARLATLPARSMGVPHALLLPEAAQPLRIEAIGRRVRASRASLAGKRRGSPIPCPAPPREGCSRSLVPGRGAAWPGSGDRSGGLPR